MVELEITRSLFRGLMLQLSICGVLWVLVCGAILVDMWDRIQTQKKLNKKIKSHKLRITLQKASEYWRFLIIAFIIDMVVFIVLSSFGLRTLPYISLLFSIILLLIEVKSLIEHAKERKSDLADMRQIMQEVLQAACTKDAKKVIKDIANYLDSKP